MAKVLHSTRAVEDKDKKHPRSLETTDADVNLFVWFSSTNKSTILIPRIIIHKDSAASVPEFIRNDCPLAISIWDPFHSLPFLCHFLSTKVSWFFSVFCCAFPEADDLSLMVIRTILKHHRLKILPLLAIDPCHVHHRLPAACCLLCLIHMDLPTL